ncbi:MAG TPA: dihydropteroate synthase, partial [Deltaproteobacteria bacterium]|nr:dihydropteroate synthase [Deltaproteobacteria bacterium]
MAGETTLCKRKPLVMGIVNVTPDSFFDGGKYYSPEAAIRHGLGMVEEGADIIDIGGESTKP